MRMTSMVAGLGFVVVACGGGNKSSNEQTSGAPGQQETTATSAPAANAPAATAPAGTGKTHDVNMELDGGQIMLGFPSVDYQSPKHHAEACEPARKWQETPHVVDGVYVTVDDVDAHYERARAAGAVILSELEDNPGVGQRQYRAADLEGHRWMFAAPT